MKMSKSVAISLCLVAMVALVAGCLPLPMGYYTFLRILICAVAVILLFYPKSGSITCRHIVNGVVAILFNPIIPVYLHSKPAWIVIDAVTAGWFLLQAILFIKSTHYEKE